MGDAVIFLDMDGVLATYRAFRQHPDKPVPDRWIDAACVTHLNVLCRQSGARIVVSSTWRLNRPADVFLAIMRRHNFAGEMHADWRTKDLQSEMRGDEVRDWMLRHPEISRHVILDDDPDFHPGQPLVQTAFERGLEAWHVPVAMRFLCGIADA